MAVQLHRNVPVVIVIHNKLTVFASEFVCTSFRFNHEKIIRHRLNTLENPTRLMYFARTFPR